MWLNGRLDLKDYLKDKICRLKMSGKTEPHTFRKPVTIVYAISKTTNPSDNTAML